MNLDEVFNLPRHCCLHIVCAEYFTTWEIKIVCTFLDPMITKRKTKELEAFIRAALKRRSSFLKMFSKTRKKFK